MVEKLCDKLNKTDDEVYDSNYIGCLNWLSMWHLKEDYIHHLETRRNKY